MREYFIELIPLAGLQKIAIIPVTFGFGNGFKILFVLIDKADLSVAESGVDIVRCTSVGDLQPTKVHFIYDLILVLIVFHLVLVVIQARIRGRLRQSDVIWLNGVT